MEATTGGGDQGTVSETVTHPKPGDGNMLVCAGQEKSKYVEAQKDIARSSKETLASSHGGSAAFIEGEIVDEEEEAIEVVLEEDEVQKAGQWTILARFYSLRIPNQVGPI